VTIKNNLLPPKPWIVDQPKAFVLGCDPTAFYKNGAPRKFEYVFNLQKTGDKRYFAGILKNLEALGLGLDCIYVQNLVPDYQSLETAKNKEWPVIAAKEIPLRKQEFDGVDPSGLIPVFLTSERLYKVLMNDGEPLLSAKELYKQENVLIPASKNKLCRPLIALYRHPKYQYAAQEDYFNRIKDVFKSSLHGIQS